MSFAHAHDINASHGVFSDVRMGSNSVYAHQVYLHTDDRASGQFQDNLINSLPRVPQARYDANNGISQCLEGTRSALLHEIEEWAQDADLNKPRIYWLSGLAGTGKSTIAHTVAENLRTKSILGGSFFFSRDDSQRSSSSKVFSTIAYHLSLFDPVFKTFIADSLRADPDVASASIKTQLEELIIKPLQRVVGPHLPTIIVMDALDECHPVPDASDMVVLLASQICKLPFPFKVFVTSRPDYHILAKFEHQLRTPISHTFILHDMESSIVEADIERYLQHMFVHIGETLVGRVRWWKEEELKALAKKSAGLFIFASTAIKFISEEHIHSPQQQLDIILDVQPTTGLSPFQDLDLLYERVIRNAVPDTQSGHLSGRFRTIVGAIVLIYDSLASGPLECLLQEKAGSVRATLGMLHSVIVAPLLQDQPIRIVHPSFADFLTSPGRCSDMRFFVDTAKHHGELASRCLEHMTSRLRRDICKINDSSKLNHEVEDLSEQLDNMVPPDLRYACVHWASHLAEASPYDTTLLDCLISFCFKSLLHWLEVLSLLGSLNVAIPALTHAQRWLRNDLHNLGELLADAKRFILEFFEPIQVAALHVYYSALPFTPYDTLFFKTFHHELASSVKVHRGRDKTWKPCLRVIEGQDGKSYCVAFSPDGTRITTASGNMVQIWDLMTGTHIMALEGHSDTVTSATFSHDSTRIVSGSADMTVRLWYANTGVPTAILYGHSDIVTSGAFSPDSARIVSGSFDGTIRLWDSITGACIINLSCSGNKVWSVAFSPDGTRIVSGSDGAFSGSTVHIWDPLSGTSFGNIKCSHNALSVAYSPCGTSIAAATFNSACVHVWNTITGALVTVFDHSTPFEPHTLAFSPDGMYIAAGKAQPGSGDVFLWEWSTSKAPIATFKGHTDDVTSVAFSPDGKCIASCSRDGTVRLWDAATGGEVGSKRNQVSWESQVTMSAQENDIITSEDHSRSISFLAFSPNGEWMVSGSNDTTLRLWSSASGAVAAVFDGSSEITVATFSPDGMRIVSGGLDGTLQLWDLSGRCLSAHIPGDHSGPTSRITSLSFSPNSTLVVSGGDNANVKLWDFAHCDFVTVFRGHRGGITSVAWISDGVSIISGSRDGSVRLWNSKTVECVAVLARTPPMSHPSVVACSPRGAFIVFATTDGTSQIFVWDSSKSPPWTHSADFRGHDTEVESITFTEDGGGIVSKSANGVIRFWDFNGAAQSTSSYKYTLIGEWVECMSGTHRRKVCWLPAAARLSTLFSTTKAADCGDYVTVGTSSGRLTILDFSSCTYN